jgi:hypothetical protein
VKSDATAGVVSGIGVIQFSKSTLSAAKRSMLGEVGRE